MQWRGRGTYAWDCDDVLVTDVDVLDDDLHVLDDGSYKRRSERAAVLTSTRLLLWRACGWVGRWVWV